MILRPLLTPKDGLNTQISLYSNLNIRDTFGIMKDPKVLDECVLLLAEHIQETHGQVDVIVGLDARGFIFGAMVAQKLQTPFLPVRKAGKLPGETIKVSYTLEYGSVCI